ncbi:MAG: lipoyl-dependent peroxiredoxin [Thermoleophilaceae bacterium]|nr:lipoyl-dependent peroxiredoxin [Thermoleophilaceae bacterium]MEA2402295.1 lipoyl-dependent peroxiredoxin [Thermoleophilaceae bacterium]
MAEPHERRADIAWSGDLEGGTGTIWGASVGLRQILVNWPSRAESSGGWTGPEELLAAAQAGSYAMALARELGVEQTVAQRLDVSVTFTVEVDDGSPRVTQAHINAMAMGTDIEQEAFDKAAKAALEACSITALVRGSADVSLEASVRDYRVKVGQAEQKAAGRKA